MIENGTGIFETINETDPIYIMGDIHGDYQVLVHCLIDLCKSCRTVKLYKDEYENENREYIKWNVNDRSTIVFCGDLIHRKRFDHVLDDECSDVYIIQTLLRLKKEAIAEGGNIILISGNHEIMNMMLPDENVYTSKLNLETNRHFFTDATSINEYIKNSYAWIKINDILITHGGLCSDYLKYIDKHNIINSISDINKNTIVEFINKKYHEYFTNFDVNNMSVDAVGYDLFIEYDLVNKKKHNMFWCREWGYSGIDCDRYKAILEKVGCNKMIIAHCPQFLSPDKPKMINFECKKNNIDDIYNLARVDLGMSRSFDYNKSDNFMFYLTNNYNRKMSILKLSFLKNELCFNNDGIITERLSCIQYLLLKYGLSEKEWNMKHIKTNWIGFKYIHSFVKKLFDVETVISSKLDVLNLQISVDTHITKSSKNETIDDKSIIMCLLYPLTQININNVPSIKDFNKYMNKVDKTH